VTLFGYGIQPEVQALYVLEAGRDLVPNDTVGVLLSRTASTVLRAGIGDSITLIGRLDPQVVTAAVGRRFAVRGLVHWIYDYKGQPSVGTVLPVMQHLANFGSADRASLIVVKLHPGVEVSSATNRLAATLPELEVNSVADLVNHFKQRLVYFRQLSYILGSLSSIVTVLLVATMLSITVNERLGEIATLRAIGISRVTVVRQVLLEGAALTLIGGACGIVLGVLTARYLDAILTSFPGLPAAFSFFVPRRESLAVAALLLLAAGSLAGLYPAWLAARAPIASTLRSEAP
jgi:putative ABC transport system permease protein